MFQNLNSCDIICVGQIHSIIWATITVVSIFVILQKLLRSITGALSAVLFTLIAHDFWVFSTQLEVYIPAVGCLSFLTAILFQNKAGKYIIFNKHYIGCSILWALAVFYHQANVIFLIPLGYFMFSTRGKHAWKAFFFICTIAGLIVLTTYIAVFVNIKPELTFEKFFTWTTGISNVPLTDWGDFTHWRLSSLKAAVGNQASTIVADRGFIFSFSKVKKRELIALIICMLLFWNILKSSQRNDLQKVRIFFLVWFATYFMFFSWWDPRVHKFYIPSMIPLIILGSFMVYDLLQVQKIPKPGKVMLQIGVGCLILWIIAINLSSSVLPLKRSKGGDYYYEAKTINSLAPNDCYIYGSGKQIFSLTFHFNRNLEKSRGVRQLYEAFYHEFKKGNTPQGSWFENENCSFIQLSWISLKFFNYKTGKEFSNKDWDAFLGWFLQIRQHSNKGTVSHNAFEVISNQSGPLYIHVDRLRRIKSDNIESLRKLIKKNIQENYKRFGSRTGGGVYPYSDLKDPEYSKKYIRQKIAFGY